MNQSTNSKEDKTYKFGMIAEKIRENIEPVLDALEIDEYENYYDKISMACPIHGGDNKDACNIFIGDKAYVVNWKCFTHHCESETNTGIFGFIQGRLSVLQNREVKMHEAISWCENLFKDTNFANRKRFNANNWIDNIENKKIAEKTIKIHKEQVSKRLLTPVHFYINRGISQKVLDTYNVGICTDKHKKFYNRIVVPVFDSKNEYAIGFVARTLYNKCDKCKYYHSKDTNCPETRLERYFGSKWINSTGFKAENYFYNYWHAITDMQRLSTVILVEGQGDVWKIVQSGHYNVLGCFGSKVKEIQKQTLIDSGISNVIIWGDPDDAGKSFYNQADEELGRYFNIYSIESEKDPQDTTEVKINELINNIYRKIGI